MLGSVRSANHGSTTASDFPSLSQSLSLEQITLTYQKHAHSVELKRILGVPLGKSFEDHCFGSGYSKPIPPLPIEKLEMFKDSVQDTLGSARDRAMFWQRYIIKLDRYEDAARSTKRQRTDHLSNERIGQKNILKKLCNPNGNPPQKQEDKSKSSGIEMKKHLRTSILDTRKGRGMLKVGDDVHIEEKIPRLPAGGGGWDKKRKRKRSFGAAGNRLITVEKNVKQAVHSKLSAETMLQPLQAQICRSRASSRMVGIQNSVKSHLPTHFGSSTESRIEVEAATHLRDSSSATEEKTVSEGKNKADINENQAVNHSSVTGKISRTPKTCSVSVVESSPDIHNSSGADAGGEQAVNKIKSISLSVENSKMRPMSLTTGASKMSHLVARRPLTPLSILRTRMADPVLPASNNDEVKISYQGFSPSGVGARPSCGAGVSLHVGRVDIYSPSGKVGLDNFSSPAALSNGVINASIKAAASLYPARKKNVLVKGRTGDSVEARGRMSSAKLVVTPATEKVENSPAQYPLQSVSCSSDKYRSKFGRPPLKKQMIQKSSIHSGKVVNNGFPDYAGQLEDDHEELLIAANAARNASYRACSSSFWKKMECYFTSVTSQDVSYLKHQLDFANALSGILYQMPGDENNDLDDLKFQQYPIYSGGRQESPADQESIRTTALSGCSGMTKTSNEAPSLFQRVLSAFIEEDGSKEIGLQNDGRNDFQYASDDSHCGSCNYNDIEAENRDRMASKYINCEPNVMDMEHEVESVVDLQLRKQGLLDRNSCDKSVSSITDSNRSVCSSVCNSEHWQADDGLSYYAGLGSSLESNASPVSSPNCNYHMLSVEDKLRLELQSIDLYPEMHPIADGEDDSNQEILELQAELVQQAQKRQKYIGKIYEAVQNAKDAEKRNLEQVALSKLIEMAYKKRMVRGSPPSKRVLRRVSKQVALPFAERTLARCRKFEDTGRSCFSEAALENIIFSSPTCNSDPNSFNKHAYRSANSRYKGLPNHNLQHRGSGSLDKQQYLGMNQEVLLNDVGSASSKAMPVGSVKGKRSERAKDQTIKTISNQFVPCIGHPPVGSSVGVCQSKPKPMVKASYFFASEDKPGSRYMEPTNAASESARASSSMANVSDVIRRKEELSNEEKKENLANPSAEQLTEFGLFEHEDYTSLLDFDVDGLQDQDLQGLQIPMDDLTDVHMYM